MAIQTRIPRNLGRRLRPGDEEVGDQYARRMSLGAQRFHRATDGNDSSSDAAAAVEVEDDDDDDAQQMHCLDDPT